MCGCLALSMLEKNTENGLKTTLKQSRTHPNISIQETINTSYEKWIELNLAWFPCSRVIFEGSQPFLEDYLHSKMTPREENSQIDGNTLQIISDKKVPL